MQLAAYTFAFGEPGTTGRILMDLVLWSLFMAPVIAWVPRQILRLETSGHAAAVAGCFLLALVSSYWHATGHFQRIELTGQGEVALSYEDPRARRQVLAFPD